MPVVSEYDTCPWSRIVRQPTSEKRNGWMELWIGFGDGTVPDLVLNWIW